MFQKIEPAVAGTPVTVSTMVSSTGLSAGEVVSLHRHLFADTSLDRTEATALFDLERAALSRCEAWTTFFIEALTDHAVWGERPTGRLDETTARWLIAEADATRSRACFALLVNVLDEAASVPAWFEAAVRARALAGWPDLLHGEDQFSRPMPAAA